jgi:hypothetical protein
MEVMGNQVFFCGRDLLKTSVIVCQPCVRGSTTASSTVIEKRTDCQMEIVTTIKWDQKMDGGHEGSLEW